MEKKIAANHGAEMGNNFSDEDVENLAGDIESTLKFVKNSKRPSTQDCIIRCVDPLLRRVNGAAYRPVFVIIGPLRNYKSLLEPTEIQKQRYLDSFLQRSRNSASLIEFCKLIKQSAPKIHSCYAETHYRRCNFQSHQIQQNIRPSDDSFRLFIKMILVDASFIIELFLRVYNKKWESDYFFDSPGKIHGIRRDLFLAHNQLPLFILKQIYELAFAHNPNFPSFIHLICYFFHHYYNQNITMHDLFQSNPPHVDPHVDFRAKLEGAKHFTDLLRTLQLPYPLQGDSSNEKSLCCKPPFKARIMYFVGFIRSSPLPLSRKPGENLELESGHIQGEYLYSATLLREAGVKFKVSSSRCLLDVEFNQNKGELTIPPLKLDESTESFFRNLMGWEQGYYPHETHICDYIFLMEYLIKSTEDVDLLVRKRIIINQLGSHMAVVTLFKNLCKHIRPEENNRYSQIFRELNAYNAVRRHSWIAILKLLYFSTLWRGVATIAAVALLVLTLVQTICAVISLY